MMQFEAYAPILTETHLIITEVLDGDGIKVSSKFKKNEKEIRLYGIDAPENRICRKLRDDEKKTQLAGNFIMYLGQLSTRFVLSIAPPGTNVTLLTEEGNFYDYYRRQLAYVILPDGRCLNEILLHEGYARVEAEYYCKRLHEYSRLNFAAKQAKSGLYALVDRF
jgi:micrococcal nuclease